MGGENPQKFSFSVVCLLLKRCFLHTFIIRKNAKCRVYQTPKCETRLSVSVSIIDGQRSAIFTDLSEKLVMFIVNRLYLKKVKLLIKNQINLKKWFLAYSSSYTNTNLYTNFIWGFASITLAI